MEARSPGLRAGATDVLAGVAVLLRSTHAEDHKSSGCGRRHGGLGGCSDAENWGTEPRGGDGAYAEHPEMPNRRRDSTDP